MTSDVQTRLWPFVAGIARKNKLSALAVGGVSDHVHMLVSLPATVPLSKAVQLVKAGSSGWLSRTFPGLSDFAWQEGYGAFSVGVSQKAETASYIEAQEMHHQRRTFQEEYLGFLKKHGVEYDERYLWG